MAASPVPARDFSGHQDATGRRLRRNEIWRRKLAGERVSDIADALAISEQTVWKDLAEMRETLREAQVFSAKEALAEFLERNREVVRLAHERMQREATMEDQHGELVREVLDTQMAHPELRLSLPQPPRTSHASLIGEIRKASTDFGQAMGILRNNATIEISLKSDRDLVLEAIKLGIDIAALGLADPTQPRAALPEAVPAAAIEGTYTISEQDPHV